MNLGTSFLSQIENRSLKPNLVVVFSPPGQLFTTPASNKPNSNRSYNGSQSYIFWKHEPDTIYDTTEAVFNNHLSKHIGQDVPLNCIDSVNISGSEVDLKDATTQDDNVEISVVLDNPGDKSFFQSLIGQNVEIYFGFRDSGYAFEDYERFYVGALRGLTSNSNLSISLRVGNIADYWNKTWRHSRGMQPTKLAYAYPLDDAFQKEGDGDRTSANIRDAQGIVTNDYHSVSWKPEWSIRQIATDLTPWGFDYVEPFSFGVTRRGSRPSRFLLTSSSLGLNNNFGARPEYNLSARSPRLQSFIQAGGGRIRRDGNNIWLRNYEPLYPTSTFIFQPSGPIDNVINVSPELVSNRRIYPDTDAGFLRAIRTPGIKNRIRFKVGSTVVESQYIDQVGVYPFWMINDQIVSNVLVSATRTQGYKNLVNYVTRGRPPRVASINLLYNNFITSGGRVRFLNFIQESAADSGGNIRDIENPDPYTLDRQTFVPLYGGPIPRFNFATKLKIFVRPKFEQVEVEGQLKKASLPKPPTHSAGENVQFYDLETGIDKIGNIIKNNLITNLGISPAVIDSASFDEATANYNVGIGAPKNRSGEFLNSDYSFSGGEDDFKAHLEEKILRSNNLRLISDGGVLRCIYLGLNNLREKQAGDDPYVLSEDDLIESTVYETRQEDYVNRLKIRAGLPDLENEENFTNFYAHDNRSPDRSQGSIFVAATDDPAFNEIDHEEIDLFTNFTPGSATVDEFANVQNGMVGPLYGNSRTNTSFFNMFKWVRDFARDYFNVNNPFIRLTVVAGPRAIGIDVGEIFVLRDHQAVEIFGSQFIKVMVVNKSINNWGTDTLQVTLDCLFISKSLDFLETGEITSPQNLRLVSRERNAEQPYNITDATVTWDVPSSWGQDESPDIRFYEVVEATSTGERVLFKLPVGQNAESQGSYSWRADTRTLLMNLDNPSTYHIYVRADNGVKRSPASNILSIDTFAQSTVPSPPLNLQGTKDERSAVLNWQPPASTGNEEFITYNLYINGELFLNVGGGRAYRYNIDGRGAETISFFVTAQNSRGESEPSNTVTLNFDALRPTPTGSLALSTVENGTSAIRLFITHNLQEADQLEITRDGVSIRTVAVGASPQQFEDLGLESNTRYCYRVIAINDSGPGVESNVSCATTLEETIDAVPGPVQLLRTTDVTTNTIDIGWLAPLSEGSSSITHYNVCWSTDNTNFTCVNETDVDHEFTSLTPGTTYYLRVSAVNDVGEGPRELLIVNTLGASLVPTKPVITAEQTEYESPFQVDISLNLENLTSDVITSYVIEKSSDNVTFNTLTTNNSPAASNTYNDTASLVDGSTYYYRARTTNAVGNSAYSDVVSVEIVDCEKREGVISDTTVRFKDATAEQKQTGSWILFDRTNDVDGEGTDDPCGSYDVDNPKPLSAVRNLALLLAHTVDADIEWDAPLFLGGHALARYDVQVVGRATIERVTSENTTVMGLTADTQYTVRVRPVNTFGTAGPWASVTFRTLALPPPPPRNVPGAPTNLKIQVSHSAIDKAFLWDAPSDLGNPNLTHYVLRLSPGNSDYQTSSTERLIRVRNLLYATNYTAKVKAVNAQGDGPFSNLFTFRTEDGIPSPPRNIAVDLVGETSVRVTWDSPLVTNGEITLETVYHRELSSGEPWTKVEVTVIPVDEGRPSTLIHNFERGKTYEFEMTASTSAGESLLTGEPAYITIPEFEAPGAVTISCEAPIPPPE